MSFAFSCLRRSSNFASAAFFCSGVAFSSCIATHAASISGASLWSMA
jgi:hypothetical protein